MAKSKKYVKSKGGMARGPARAQGHQKTIIIIIIIIIITTFL